MSNLGPGTHGFTVNGTRQVCHVADDGPVVITRSGSPGVAYSYLRSRRLENHFNRILAPR